MEAYNCAEFTASVDNSASINVDSISMLSAPGLTSALVELTVVSANMAYSDLFGVSDMFTGASEPFWPLQIAAGAAETDFLIENYHHSETPVKYTRLDDLELTFVGGILDTVTRESGDKVLLEYDVSGNLTRVTNTYLGIRKDLAYGVDGLQKVTTIKT